MTPPPGVQPVFGTWRRRRPDSAGPPAQPQSLLRRLVVPVAVVGILGLSVSLVAVPLRAHLDRTSQIADAEVILAELVRTNEADRERLEAMETDAELEYLARRDFGLARPGEEIYQVLAPASEPLVVPEGWPFNYVGLRLVQP